MHIHDYRPRLLWGHAAESTEIVRFRCSNRDECGAVVQVLPAFVARWLWRSWETVELAMEPAAPRPEAAAPELEFWVGPELLDRVRFNVPLLGDDDRERDPKRPLKKPTFSKVTTKVKAQMADHPRATVLAFVDRATGDTRKYFWPPDENGKLTVFSAKAATAAADGGTSGDGGTSSDGGGGDAAADGAGDAALDATPDAASADSGTADAGRVR